MERNVWCICSGLGREDGEREENAVVSGLVHDDIREIFSGTYLPKVYQSFLMSATMTEDVELLKGLTLRNPVCPSKLRITSSLINVH